MLFNVNHDIIMLQKMLKWTVSRSLSNANSTPHAQPPSTNEKSTRRPFRDLSNTPPTGSTSTRSRILIDKNDIQDNTTLKPTPGRRKRCRSHGSDLRAYFNVSFHILNNLIFFPIKNLMN